MADDTYYPRLRDKFDEKRRRFSEGMTDLGFQIYDSGSAFYLWARIPETFNDAIAFNEMLMRDAGVGMTPGSAFADSDDWDAYVRICIAREDNDPRRCDGKTATRSSAKTIYFSECNYETNSSPFYSPSVLLVSVSSSADEGMWTFDNPPLKQWKERYNFEPSKEWLDKVRLASPKVNGASAVFVSPNGLIATNHHVAAGYIERVSSKERDLMKTGFTQKHRLTS